jgi:hypothetical protein
MAVTATSSVLPLPVDAATLTALRGAACILCGAQGVALRPAGWRTTVSPDGSRLGWAVAACPNHADAQE